MGEEFQNFLGLIYLFLLVADEFWPIVLNSSFFSLKIYYIYLIHETRLYNSESNNADKIVVQKPEVRWKTKKNRPGPEVGENKKKKRLGP